MAYVLSYLMLREMRPARASIVRILWDAVVPVSPQRVVMCGKKHTADAVVIIEITINKNFILCGRRLGFKYPEPPVCEGL